MASPSPTLRLGTRGSLLARTQSQLIAAAIEKANPSVAVELVILKTTGDQVQDKPLADIGGKGLFTKELEQALLRNEIDLAVHSFKDVPVTMPLVDQSELGIACVPEREDARDVLICREGASDVAGLPAKARVGTGSLRRRCQLLDLRPDLQILPLRGNIDTRLRKLRDGEYDAIVLAQAGLKRVGLFDSSIMTVLPADQVTPAPGQGALALQTRREDVTTQEILKPLHDEAVARCVAVERLVVLRLDGDCHSPIAAYATLADDQVTLQAALGQPGGELPVRRKSASFALSDAEKQVAAIATALING
jgi:hydroxymethylbilane synthase